MNSKAFTLVEILVVVFLMGIILFSITVPAFRYFREKSDLNSATEEIINALRLAQSRTLASEGGSQHGLYFDLAASPHQYILFRGNGYSSREPSFDEIFQLPRTVEIYNLDLQGGSEVVFNRLNGTTAQTGSFSLRLIVDTSEIKTIYVESTGQVGSVSFAVPSDENRFKDSRHLHFDYSRSVDTATEKLTLTFYYNSSSATEEIILVDNMMAGQIYWQGEVDVGGEIQKLIIHTHRLNDLDTQFCIHRDREDNNRALTITISGDGSGSLVEYSADGLITASTSIYVSNLQWQ